MRKVRLIHCLAFILLLFATNMIIAQPGQLSADERANYHAFDFWIGAWDVYKFGTDTLVGYSKIVSINDSTGILENYESARGKYQGKSLNTYNRESGNWEQYWIDNTGLVLKLQGMFRDGKMIMLDFDGLTGNKISWQRIGTDVRQTWESTTDGGASWSVLFDGRYKPKVN